MLEKMFLLCTLVNISTRSHTPEVETSAKIGKWVVKISMIKVIPKHYPCLILLSILSTLNIINGSHCVTMFDNESKMSEEQVIA